MKEILSKNIRSFRAVRMFSIAILCIGLATTLIALHYVQEASTRTARNRFDEDVTQIEYALSRRITSYYSILHSLQALFAASESVDRHEWSPFVKTAQVAEYPDIEYVSYIEIVNDTDKEEFITNFRSDSSTNPGGYPNLEIFPPEIKGQYAVVKYMEPENPESSKAYGFDLYSSPEQKKALDTAVDTNQPTASEIITLVTDNSSGFLIAAPVYEKGESNTTVEERRNALKGFVTISFKTDRIFSNIFPVNSHPGVIFTIYDEGQELHTSKIANNNGTDVTHTYAEMRYLTIGGRTWVLNIVDDRSAEDSLYEKALWWIVGIGGTLFSFLSFWIVYYFGKRTSQFINLQSAILESAGNGIVITDTKGVIQWVNPAFTKLTGYEAREAVGQSTQMLNSGKQDKKFYEVLWKTILEGKVWSGEITNKRKDGSLYTEEEMISPVKDSSGTITNFIAIKQDITQRKQLEEKILTANQELADSKKAMANVLEDLSIEKAKLEQEAIKDDAILSSIGEGLIVTDQKGKIVLVNKAFEELLGWKQSEVIGKNMLDIVQKYDEKDVLIPPEKRSLTKVLEGKTQKSSVSTLTTTHQYLRRNRTKLPIVGIVTPIILNNEIVGAVQVFRDISKEKEIDAMKDEFLSVASHELRTPLTAIDGLLSMIFDGEYGPINEELKQPLADVSTSSERLIRLVNDLLSLSRIQAGRLKYVISEFELSRVIVDIVQSLQPISKKKGIDLTADVGEKIVVQGDSDKVIQILHNLIGNSLKFTDRGTIVVSSNIQGNVAHIAVADTGVGISKEDQGKLFGKFQQLDTTRGRPSGTGLGLHISREMARKMGGDVWIESSEAGHGSTFICSLPVAKTCLARKTETDIEQEAIANPDQK